MVIGNEEEDIAMRPLKHFCREHRITHKRALWLGLIVFGDDILIIMILVVSHYLHLASNSGM